jgi:hypothetical protein
MRKTLKSLVFLAAAIMLVLLFSFAGCTKYANEQQLQALEETKAAALAAEEALADCKGETTTLEGKLAEKKKELENAKKEKQVVSQRLAAM